MNPEHGQRKVAFADFAQRPERDRILGKAFAPPALVGDLSRLEGLAALSINAFAPVDGPTPRNAYIQYSENVLKPKFGTSHLGDIALRRVKSNRDEGHTPMLSGAGFLDEVLTIMKAIGSEKTLHLKLSRPDSSNSKVTDSREALDLTSYGVKTVSIINDMGSGFLLQIGHLLA